MSKEYFWYKLKVLVVLIVISFMLSSCTSTYMGRLIIWNFSGYEGYKKYPKRQVRNGSTIYRFQENKDFVNFSLNSYNRRDNRYQSFKDLLQKNDTTSFIVIKNSTVIYEEYFHGASRNSISPAFSVSKSILSLLIGIAIEEGKINNIDNKITDYLPELKEKEVYAITIKQLLTMSSGLEHHKGYGFLPWGSDIRIGMSPDVQELALSLKSKEKPGQSFLYHNHVPILLAMILNRATGKTISQYTEEKLWEPMGMEYPAFWILDSEKEKFEKTDGGFNARSIDYAKLGQLIINKGKWDGKQIISENWIKESTSPDLSKEYLTNIYNRKGFYYKYLWWGLMTKSSYSPIAIGRYGQFIFMNPELDIVIIRNGSGMGNLSFDKWFDLFEDVVHQTENIK